MPKKVRSSLKGSANNTNESAAAVAPSSSRNIDNPKASSTSAASSTHQSSKRNEKVGKKSSIGMSSISVISLVVGIVAYNCYLGYLETRIKTPLNQEKIININEKHAMDRFWGSYRPGFYFGMKHRSPKSLVTGLMWLIPSKLQSNMNPPLRHECQQGDNLKKYGWLEHDGVNFGLQEIEEVDFKITTSFVKRQGGTHGGDWTARVQLEPLVMINKTDDKRDEAILIFYIALEPNLSGLLRVDKDLQFSPVSGHTDDLGNFNIRFLSSNGILKSSTLFTKITSLNGIRDLTLNSIVGSKSKGKILYHFNEGLTVPDGPNIVLCQVHTKGSFTLDIVFESSSFSQRPSTLAGEVYTKRLQQLRNEFRDKFEDTFHLAKKSYDANSITFAQAALSNLVGGIGYFFGSSKVQSLHNSEPVLYWPAALYTAVPSRSFFPRGFLWDEGFHLLLINKWNPEISLDIVSHWLDLMNTEGWIPREQILGEEANVRVPEEFVVQRNDNANPPTLILALADLLSRHKDWLYSNHKETLYKIWPRVATWYQWLNKTQIGELPFTYRWRGRNSTTQRELNPKTLASGLDDYPRASHPTDSERHLDLRCWMAAISKLMRDLAEILGFDSDKYQSTYDALSDLELLNTHHWSKDLQAYTDYGFHSNNVALKYPSLTEAQKRWQERNRQQFPLEKVRMTLKEPSYGFVNMFGYVNLFPMLLRMLPHDSIQLISTLRKIRDVEYLWTPFGLRSLSANAPLYSARNTEHDPPYWRGPIWININFLALKSLKYYSQNGEEGSTSGKLAKEIYNELKNNIVNNIKKEYQRTGYLWEQYNDKTGEGQGCRPFTGWTSLVVLIMSDEY